MLLTARFAALMLFTAPALLFASTSACTSDVPAAVCKTATALADVRHIRADVLFMSSDAFKRRQDELNKDYEQTVRLTPPGAAIRNPIIPNSYTEDVIFERGPDTCPSRVLISTEALRPVTLDNGRLVKGDGVGTGLTLTINYIAGFVEGCRMGQALRAADEMWKLRAGDHR